jgi:hypothetical protein
MLSKNNDDIFCSEIFSTQDVMFVTRSFIRIKHCTVVLVNNFIFSRVPFAHPVLLFLCGLIAWFVSLVSKQVTSALPVWNQA